jgi:hypothetical protein
MKFFENFGGEVSCKATTLDFRLRGVVEVIDLL